MAGDLFAAPLVPVLESPHSTFLHGVDELEPVDEHGLWTVAAQQIDTGWGAIVTQTCDLVGHPDKVPFLQLMPVVELDELRGRPRTTAAAATTSRCRRSTQPASRFPQSTASSASPLSKAVLGHPDIPRVSLPWTRPRACCCPPG